MATDRRRYAPSNTRTGPNLPRRQWPNQPSQRGQQNGQRNGANGSRPALGSASYVLPPQPPDVAGVASERSEQHQRPSPLPGEIPAVEHAERALVALALDAVTAIRQPAAREVERLRLEKFRDFHDRAVAEVIQTRRARGEDSDLITVFGELQLGGLIGDDAACVFHDFTDFTARYLAADLVTSLDADAYARQIHRAYAQRVTIERARDLYVTATQGPDEIAAALPIIVTEINAANREVDPDGLYARFAPVDLRQWRLRPRARMLDAELRLREGQSLMIYGETNSGKTLYLLYRLALLACGVSTGEPEHVLYYCGEGQAGILGRIEALLLYHHLDADTFYDHFHLVPDMPQLVTAPEELAAALELAKDLDVPFTVVALDTLTTALSGLNDNAAENMTAAYGAVRQIARELSATPMLVHHPGKDLTRGPRGSGVMKNGLDVTIEVSQAEQNGIVTIRHDKMRDGEKHRWAYRIVRQLLPGDEWSDDPQPVLQAGATPAAPQAANKAVKLDATALQVLQILQRAGGLKWTAWLNHCVTHGLNQSTAKTAMFRVKEAGRVGKVEETGEWQAIPESPESPEASETEGGAG